MSLRGRALERAAEHHPNTGGKPCTLGQQILELADDLAADAASIVHDRAIPVAVVLEVLEEEGVHTTGGIVQKHRRTSDGCKWCERHGLA